MEHLHFYLLLATIQDEYHYITIGELAKRTPDLSRTKRYRLLSQLIDFGYIHRIKRGEYLLSHSLSTLAIYNVEKRYWYGRQKPYVA